jgi:hypothetical protein
VSQIRVRFSAGKDPDHALLTRLRDLTETLPGDVSWLAGPPLRADGLRDLGERLACLDADLIGRAGVLDEIAAARLPAHGWIPGCGPDPRRRLAHYVGRGEVRLGLSYFASCFLSTPAIPRARPTGTSGATSASRRPIAS